MSAFYFERVMLKIKRTMIVSSSEPTMRASMTSFMIPDFLEREVSELISSLHLLTQSC